MRSILAGLQSLPQHKFSQRQIAGVGDLGIRLLVCNENDSAPVSFNCGNFVRDGNIPGKNSAISLFKDFALEDLRSLHREEPMSINRLLHDKIDIRALERICDWSSEGRRAVFLGSLINALDLLGRDERTRGIVHGNMARIFGKFLQTSAN